MTERTCSKTGLYLIEARGERAYRVAKDRYGALSARGNEHVGPKPVGFYSDAGDSRGRYDTLGSTIYLADSRRCAYAEVLNGFRQERARIAETATSIGMSVDEYIEAVTAEAETNDVSLPWTISADWQMDRSIYQIRLPRQGWWVRIDHMDSLRALEGLAPGSNDLVQLASENVGPDPVFTTTAEFYRLPVVGAR